MAPCLTRRMNGVRSPRLESSSSTASSEKRSAKPWGRVAAGEKSGSTPQYASANSRSGTERRRRRAGRSTPTARPAGSPATIRCRLPRQHHHRRRRQPRHPHHHQRRHPHHRQRRHRDLYLHPRLPGRAPALSRHLPCRTSTLSYRQIGQTAKAGERRSIAHTLSRRPRNRAWPGRSIPMGTARGDPLRRYMGDRQEGRCWRMLAGAPSGGKRCINPGR
jgi:hypothetical protein